MFLPERIAKFQGVATPQKSYFYTTIDRSCPPARLRFCLKKVIIHENTLS